MNLMFIILMKQSKAMYLKQEVCSGGTSSQATQSAMNMYHKRSFFWVCHGDVALSRIEHFQEMIMLVQ
jgi:hypothetical protein